MQKLPSSTGNENFRKITIFDIDKHKLFQASLILGLILSNLLLAIPPGMHLLLQWELRKVVKCKRQCT